MKTDISFYEKKYIRHSEYLGNIQVCGNEYLQEGKVYSKIQGINVQDRIINQKGEERLNEYKLPFLLKTSMIHQEKNLDNSEFYFWDIIGKKPSLPNIITLIHERIPLLLKHISRIKIFENVQYVDIKRDDINVTNVRNDILINITIQQKKRYISKNIYLKSFDNESFSSQLSDLSRYFEESDTYFKAKLYKLSLKNCSIVINSNAFEILHETLGHFFENLAIQKDVVEKIQHLNFKYDICDLPNSLSNHQTTAIDDVGTICRENYLIKDGSIQEGYCSDSGNLSRSSYNNQLLLRMNNLRIKKRENIDIVSIEDLTDKIEIDELRYSYYDAKLNIVFIKVGISKLYKNGSFLYYLEPFTITFQPEDVLSKIEIASEKSNVHSTLCLKRGQPKFTNLISPIILIPDIKL